MAQGDGAKNSPSSKARSLRLGVLAGALGKAAAQTGDQGFARQADRISAELATEPSPAATLEAWERYLDAVRAMPAAMPGRAKRLEKAKQMVAAKGRLQN